MNTREAANDESINQSEVGRPPGSSGLQQWLGAAAHRLLFARTAPESSENMPLDRTSPPPRACFLGGGRAVGGEWQGRRCEEDEAQRRKTTAATKHERP